MRLLIANDLDPWIVKKADVRAWAQRMLWFAEPDDVIITMDAPDPGFVAHVARAKGFNPATLVFHVLPVNRFEGKMFDHLALYDHAFIDQVRPEATAATKVIAAWPSPHIASFIRKLGLAEQWDGIQLFAQGGCELLNSMGSFRAFAAAAGVTTSRGTVCRSKEDADAATRELLSSAPAVMVKKAHGGAGAGNHTITLDEKVATAHAGSKFLTTLTDVNEVKAFWNDRWEWASASGAYPVVVEEFQPQARSIYAEYNCTEESVELAAVGELHFEERRLTRETVPETNLDEATLSQLARESRKIAEFYHRLGYRGPLSADTVISPDGDITFTEVNAQYTGSTHLYRILVGELGGEDRCVTQLTSPEHWPITSVDAFLETVKEAGCAYDAHTRRGVLAVTPKIGNEKTGPIILGILHQHPSEVSDALDRIGDAYKRTAKDN